MPLSIDWDADAAAGWLYNGRWADFAIGDKGGDVVSLVAHLEGVSQGEAARRLARMLGLEIGGRRHG